MKLEQAKARAKTASKVALEAEKEKDAAEKAVEELKRQLQPKRVHTDDDAGDAHDLLAEFDNCDLSDHRREGTRVQNRRNVQVGCKTVTRVQNRRNVQKAVEELKHTRHHARKERTMTGKITSPILVAQHLRATFCTNEWLMEHVDSRINEMVVMYHC